VRRLRSDTCCVCGSCKLHLKPVSVLSHIYTYIAVHIRCFWMLIRFKMWYAECCIWMSSAGSGRNPDIGRSLFKVVGCSQLNTQFCFITLNIVRSVPSYLHTPKDARNKINTYTQTLNHPLCFMLGLPCILALWQSTQKYNKCHLPHIYILPRNDRAGRSGDRIPVGARFFAHVQTGPGAHPVSCTTGTGSVPRVKRPGRGWEWIELYFYSPSRPLVACYKVTFTFLPPNDGLMILPKHVEVW
jgi:hypothetical protein